MKKQNFRFAVLNSYPNSKICMIQRLWFTTGFQVKGFELVIFLGDHIRGYFKKAYEKVGFEH